MCVGSGVRDMKILLKKPGEAAVFTEIDNELAALQKAVGGYIETVRVCEDLVLVCNEEGLMNDMPFNVRIGNLQLFGPVFLCGVCFGDDGEEVFCDVPMEEAGAHVMFPQFFPEGDEE